MNNKPTMSLIKLRGLILSLFSILASINLTNAQEKDTRNEEPVHFNIDLSKEIGAMQPAWAW